MCIFLKHLLALPKSSQQTKCKSYDGLTMVVDDPLMCAKFKFIEMIAWKFITYLRDFQIDNHMVPFPISTLEDILLLAERLSLVTLTYIILVVTLM